MQLLAENLDISDLEQSLLYSDTDGEKIADRIMYDDVDSEYTDSGVHDRF
jgi:hypothetical protein